jgi:hypothetical protein
VNIAVGLQSEGRAEKEREREREREKRARAWGPSKGETKDLGTRAKGKQRAGEPGRDPAVWNCLVLWSTLRWIRTGAEVELDARRESLCL